jgi:hypothetical protein
MTTDVQAQFSIAEKEEIVAELRQAWAKARHAAALAETELQEATKLCDEAWTAVVEAKAEYEKCNQALVEEMTNSL